MNFYEISFAGVSLLALGSGALFWPDEELLCVSDMHLGKSERMLRRSGPALPPYETQDTLSRLEADIEATGAQTVVCLGDSFDDVAAVGSLSENERLWIARLQAGRQWIWIEGNHDPGPIDIGGTHKALFECAPLVFCHIATPDGSGEISGHYHPKARVLTRARMITRPSFLVDERRIIMPAYGTYTGGLYCDHPVLSSLMAQDAKAVLTGKVPTCVPMPR